MYTGIRPTLAAILLCAASGQLAVAAPRGVDDPAPAPLAAAEGRPLDAGPLVPPAHPADAGPPPPAWLPPLAGPAVYGALPYGLPPPHLERLHDALALDEAQERKWQAALAAMQALATWRPALPPPGPATLARPDTPPLRALARQMDQDQDLLVGLIRDARDRWIDVDEALSGVQRAFVRGTMLTARPPAPAGLGMPPPGRPLPPAAPENRPPPRS